MRVAEYERLAKRERWYVDAYVDGAVRMPYVGVRTFCNKVWAYVIAYGADWRSAFDVKWSVVTPDGKVELDEWADGAKVSVTIKDLGAWRRLTAKAESVHTKCQSAINAVRREQFKEGDETFVNELKAAIAESAIHGATEKDRNENRKMAMKFTGLDQVKVDVGVDIYDTIGKNLLLGVKGSGVDVPTGVEEYEDEGGEE